MLNYKLFLLTIKKFKIKKKDKLLLCISGRSR